MQDFWAINIVTGYVLIFVRFKTSSIQRDSGIHFSWPTAQVQIDVRQAEALFDVLDYNNSGTLDSEEFLEAWSLGGHWIFSGLAFSVGSFERLMTCPFPRNVKRCISQKRWTRSVVSESHFAAEKKPLCFPCEGIMLARGEARSREVIATQCDLWKDLFLTYGGHWESGWWSKKLIEISIKVDSTLNLFFFPWEVQIWKEF